MIIKVLLLSGILGAVVVALRSSGSTTFLAVRRLGLIAFAVAAAGSIIFPAALTWVANQVGVGRGTDLLLYASVVLAIFVALGFHHRIQQLEERVTHLTRALAIRDARDGRK
jgi:hypothetical protein